MHTFNLWFIVGNFEFIYLYTQYRWLIRRWNHLCHLIIPEYYLYIIFQFIAMMNNQLRCVRFLSRFGNCTSQIKLGNIFAVFYGILLRFPCPWYPGITFRYFHQLKAAGYGLRNDNFENNLIELEVVINDFN